MYNTLKYPMKTNLLNGLIVSVMIISIVSGCMLLNDEHFIAKIPANIPAIEKISRSLLENIRLNDKESINVLIETKISRKSAGIHLDTLPFLA